MEGLMDKVDDFTVETNADLVIYFRPNGEPAELHVEIVTMLKRGEQTCIALETVNDTYFLSGDYKGLMSTIRKRMIEQHNSNVEYVREIVEFAKKHNITIDC